MRDLIVIAGTTASGKTAAGVSLARRTGGELVGADSVQVYRGFDIGSAKPSAADLDGVAHHMIDILEPEESIDAANYAARADEVIADVAARGRMPIVVGGTGLWIRALTRGLVPLPAVDPALRRELERRAETEGDVILHAELDRVDPEAASRIHANDRLRIVRALEVFAQTGAPLGRLRREHALGAPRYRTFFVVLDRPSGDLGARIRARIDAMFDAGWIEEARTLLARHAPSARAFGSIGYKQIVQHLEQGTSLDETRSAIVAATRAYARHQRTWFASEPGVNWRTTDGELLGEEAVERICSFVYSAQRKCP